MSKIRLLLADDHTVLRAGLKALFNAQPDMEVVAEASNGEEAVHMSRELSPDVVLMDITMPGISGFEATSEIRKQNPAVKILALTMHENDSYIHQMIRAGADSYVPKKAADTELMAAIRASYRGENFIHPSVASGLVTMARQQEPELKKDQGAGVLSQREAEVLQHLALGYTNQQIAEKLCLSVKTVESYRARIKAKLGFEGRAQLVRYAIEIGLLDK
jgi:two-component system response regulator NreC